MKRIAEHDLLHVLNTVKDAADDLKNKSIFISGATGFFGKWLLETFVYLNDKLSLNAKVFALSRDPERFLQDYSFYNDIHSITFVKGDIKDFIFPDAGIDYIIHAATEADAKLNAEQPTVMLDTIIAGTKHILELARVKKVKSFLLTSSGAVYGKQPPNITNVAEWQNFEMDFTDPLNSYAQGKRVAELYTSVYHKSQGLPVKIARCYAFVGPYLPLDKHFAIGNFIKNGLDEEDIIIKGDGTTIRSYQYAADLAAWLWVILLKGKDNTPYNVGADVGYSIAEVAQTVKQAVPAVQVKILGKRDEQKPIDNYVPDVTFAKTALSLTNHYNLLDAIKNTIQFYQ